MQIKKDWHVMCFLLARHVLFTGTLCSQTPWLSHSHFPKYYKVLKKYKGNIKARESVCFVSLFQKQITQSKK